MAFWNATDIQNINEGAQPNDGTGDTVRDAFLKVDNNFATISTFLAQPSPQFLNANVEQTLISANVTSGNIASNTLAVNIATVASSATIHTLTVSNTLNVSAGNLNLNGHIIPTASGQYDLGSVSNPFRDFYITGNLVQGGSAQTVDAGQFVVHANAAVGDTKDVGILGNVTHHYSSNTYAFFGYQYLSNNFVYKLTNTNPLLGNAVIWGGIYGGAQFGGLTLSNTTVSTNSTTGALVVSGGTGIAGNLNVGGNISGSGNLTVSGTAFFGSANIYAGGYQVLTTNTPGLTTYPGMLVANSEVITGTNPSITTTTGALVLSFGGAGIAGNINAGGNITTLTGNINAPTFNGNLNGTVLTAAQPYITSLGTISTLNAGTVSATGIGATNLTLTGTLNLSGATISSLATLTTTGNITGGNLLATTGIYTGGTIINSLISTTGNITGNYFNGNAAALSGLSYNATIVSINSAITTGNTGMKSYVDTQISTTGNAIVTANTGMKSYVDTQISTTGNAIVTANTGMKNYVDALGTLTSSNAASQQGQIGTLQTSVTTLQGQVYANSNVVSYFASGITGNVLPSANVTYNIGSTTAWWNNIYGTAIHAQYADLAERYVADADYESGTVVVFGGEKEITVTTIHGDGRVAGAISTQPAYLMNGAIDGLPVALRGRIPVKVIGAVRKGDSLVTSTTSGFAVSVGTELTWGQAVFAKSLETNLSPGEKIIEAVIL